MSKNRLPITNKRHRAVLSDVLPYEVPLTFSNRGFYEFLTTHEIDFKDGVLSWRPGAPALDLAIKLLFGIPPNAGVATSPVESSGGAAVIATLANPGDLKPRWTRSFSYKIRHKENMHRDLAVPHPRSQLALVEFYDTYQDLIVYHCSHSPFSIRFPKAVAKVIYYRDSLHISKLSDEPSAIEQDDQEYETMRSFFVYERYSNIYKFYESYQFHRMEQRFNRLAKIDISKCFDSVYTHSLAWAILGKDAVKANLNKLSNTFPGRFDSIMQHLNYNETNGIIIGPEFSRIFAELILQSIDRALAAVMDKRHKLQRPSDYDICRYVDDYFIFYNDESHISRILEELQVLLKAYNFNLNTTKTVVYTKPIITEISMAKGRISDLLEKQLTPAATNRDSATPSLRRVTSRRLITEFKIIIRECKVDYKDMLNYALSIIDRKTRQALKLYRSAAPDTITEAQLIAYLDSVLQFTFFIYSVAPRVNTTIKLCHILVAVTTFLKGDRVSRDARHVIFKVIFDQICFVMKKNRGTEHTQVETLYLLLVLSELGRDYWLDMKLLCDFFAIKRVEDQCHLTIPLNYFSITVLLFYMKDKRRYDPIRQCIEAEVLQMIKNNVATKQQRADLVMLLMDTLSCPFVSTELKTKLLAEYQITGKNNVTSLSELRSHWFTRWQNFDMARELDSKKAYEVY